LSKILNITSLPLNDNINSKSPAKPVFLFLRCSFHKMIGKCRRNRLKPGILALQVEDEPLMISVEISERRRYIERFLPYLQKAGNNILLLCIALQITPSSLENIFFYLP